MKDFYSYLKRFFRTNAMRFANILLWVTCITIFLTILFPFKSGIYLILQDLTILVLMLETVFLRSVIKQLEKEPIL